jgi:hypothetical protein
MFVRRSSVGFAPIFGSVVNVRDLRALIDCLGLSEIGCAGISAPAGETQRPLGPSDPSEARVGFPREP